MEPLSDLRRRGMVHQTTDDGGLPAWLAAKPRTLYAGFDPTADSLTIGNLVPILLLAHLQRAGHTPIVVSGGGTGLIGDPTGKSATRPPLTPEEVAAFLADESPGAFARGGKLTSP